MHVLILVFKKFFFKYLVQLLSIWYFKYQIRNTL